MWRIFLSNEFGRTSIHPTILVPIQDHLDIGRDYNNLHTLPSPYSLLECRYPFIVLYHISGDLVVRRVIQVDPITISSYDVIIDCTVVCTVQINPI